MEVKEQRERAPEDTWTTEILAEEVQLGDTDSMANLPQVDKILEQPSLMTVAAPAKSDRNIRAQTESEAEQKLAAIIKLKQSGDESWKRELELFQQQYPDYPLPDELKD